MKWFVCVTHDHENWLREFDDEGDAFAYMDEHTRTLPRDFVEFTLIKGEEVMVDSVDGKWRKK